MSAPSTIAPAELESRFGRLHDAGVESIELRCDPSTGRSARVVMKAPDPQKGTRPDQSGSGHHYFWGRLTFQLAVADEFRLSEGPHTNFTILVSRLGRVDGYWWLVLDDGALDWDDELTAENIRSTGHYIRCDEIKIRWEPLGWPEGAVTES